MKKISLFFVIVLLFSKNFAEDCRICFDALAGKKTIKLPCSHEFHTSCCNEVMKIPDQTIVMESIVDLETGETFNVPKTIESPKQCPLCRYHMGSRDIYCAYRECQRAFERSHTEGLANAVELSRYFLNKDGRKRILNVQEKIFREKSLSEAERTAEIRRRMQNVKDIKKAVINSLRESLRRKANALAEESSRRACREIIKTIEIVQKTVYVEDFMFQTGMVRLFRGHVRNVGSVSTLYDLNIRFSGNLGRELRYLVHRRIKQLTQKI